MATRYVEIPIINYPYYDLSVSLEEVSYIIEFKYVGRMNLYTMSLYDAERNPIIIGHALTPNYPILLDYAIPNMNGYFVLLDKGGKASEAYKDYPENIADYYYLFYIYDTDNS